ncbi:tetratricopeptide repeat protein [Dactylosporangium vinaceum]|uniref:Tetratricopeptide repeat protein n=1 Tax=Dactylosporangium vinaceum TaxID=53362 RepID=A0ABV5M0Y9_9ACTN|nr:tetratricopeptide repeat protein [Dactylosporangium vinaceum]UAB97228.1 tetratricopeptide repeat protein [Dactylosporangium vinaceum]
MTAILLATPVPARAAPMPSAPVGGTIQVPLPAGTALPPGTYEVVISGNGAKVATTVTVTPAPAGDGGVPGGLLFAVGLVVLVMAAVVVLLRFRRPPGDPAPAPAAPVAAGPTVLDAYHAAVRLVDAGRYHEALPRLTRIEAGLPEGLRTEAGFFIAFSLYQTLYLDEAEHRLAALHREDPDDADVAELLARLRVQRRDFDGAEPVLEGLARQRRLTSGGRKLYSIVEYQRALNALREGNIDAAATLFERVERLGDLRDRVPADLRNRHVLLGARALVEKDVTTARSHFERLEDVAGTLPAERRGDLLAAAKLGRGLAAWIDGALPDVERLLAEAIRTIDPAAPLEADWPPDIRADTLAEDIAALDAGPDGRADAAVDTRRVLRDMHFVRGLAALRAGAGDARRAALVRFACARRLDHTFADVYLVVGLLSFRLGDEQVRRHGLAALREARKRGARDPKLIRILNRYDTRPDAGPLAQMEIIESYADDPGVPAAVREELLRRLAQLGRRRDSDQRPDLAAAARSEPTVAEVAQRAELLLARVRQLEGAGVSVAAAQRAADELAGASALLAAQARAVERSEAAVLTLIGNAMLDDTRGWTS